MLSLVWYFLIAGPLVLVVAAWLKIWRTASNKRPAALSLVALFVVSANAIAAGVLFLYSQIHPSSLPPWQDPVNLDAAMLMLLAPFGMILGLFAGIYRGPGWLIWIIEIASVPLLLVGVMAGMSV